MSERAWMQVLRAMHQYLPTAGMCGKWVPAEPTLCTRPAGHPTGRPGFTCGRYSERKAA